MSFATFHTTGSSDIHFLRECFGGALTRGVGFEVRSNRNVRVHAYNERFEDVVIDGSGNILHRMESL